MPPSDRVSRANEYADRFVLSWKTKRATFCKKKRKKKKGKKLLRSTSWKKPSMQDPLSSRINGFRSARELAHGLIFLRCFFTVILISLTGETAE